MWLAAEHRPIARDEWAAPRTRNVREQSGKTSTLADYSERWMEQRELKPRTHDRYRALLDRHILPQLGDVSLARVTSEMVQDWYRRPGQDSAHSSGALLRAAAYRPRNSGD
ncbi:N-terminal phage integrase SAM-like domain-containing protein [Ornithinimicrobium cerasi]|uniref:N-terminal phage integrase SAM-like domain-containing protein n=1 Tax=Ornithinimicrobium cerasi TaxID=2248773 RepID=UPI003B026A11